MLHWCSEKSDGFFRWATNSVDVEDAWLIGGIVLVADNDVPVGHGHPVGLVKLCFWILISPQQSLRGGIVNTDLVIIFVGHGKLASTWIKCHIGNSATALIIVNFRHEVILVIW